LDYASCRAHICINKQEQNKSAGQTNQTFIKLKANSMKSILLAPVGILLRCYLAFAFVLIYFKNQKEKRAMRRIAMANLVDAKKHAQA
jgi:hypothetical protein